MNFLILDTSFNVVDVLDNFKSLLWVDRYDSFGDFELYCPINTKTLSMFHEDYYIWNSESEHTMIIENIATETDKEEGNYLVITGRSLESILDRRIIWDAMVLNGNLQECVSKLLDACIIKPIIPDRKIPNFIMKQSTDTTITALTMNQQYEQQDLYTVISEECQQNGIGFKICLNSDNQFVFELYSGKNRSSSQDTLPYVIFSPKYENLVDSNYYRSKQDYKNVTLVGGEEIDNIQKCAIVGSAKGLDRRELYTDASDISSTLDEGTMTNEEYTIALTYRGYLGLSEHQFVTAFEGEVDNHNMYIYGKDFFMGDIVQIEDEFGHSGDAYISELVFSYDTDAFSVYPTFKMIEGEVIDV